MAGIDSLDIRQQEVLTQLNIGLAVVSLSGSLFIISCFLVFPDLRKFSFQLVFWLSLSDFFLGLGNVIGNPDDGTMCNVQAYSTQFFSTASVLWTTVIAFVLHQTVVHHWTDVPNLVIHFHVFVWGTSLVLMILPASTGSYGRTGAWCWVKNENTTDEMMRFITFYLPLWFAIIFNMVGYLRVIHMLRVTMTMVEVPEGERKVKIHALQRLGYYPLILVGAWAFGTVNRIQNWVTPHQPVFWLYCAHVVMSSLQGFFNFLAYGLNSSVRKTLRNEIFSKCGVCCAKSDGQQFFEMSKFTEELEDDILEEISLDSPKAQLD